MYSAHDDNVVNLEMALGLMSFDCLEYKYNEYGSSYTGPCFNRAYYAS